MIYYHPELNKKLNSDGINIPLSDERAERLFHYLQQHLAPSCFLSPSLNSYSLEEITSVHSKKYIKQLEEQPQQAIENCYQGYVSSSFLESSLGTNTIVQKVLQQAYGTYESALYSLEKKFVYYLGGGMHHAMSDGGRGFCLINDIALAIRKLQQEKKIATAWVIDLDAHKGDGTAEIFVNDDSVRTFSIHMQNGWPLDGGDSDKRSFIASDMDVGVLPSNNYLANLQISLNNFIKCYPSPNLIYIVGGVDVWEHDELESSNLIKLTEQEVLKRDQFVFSILAQLNIPLVYLMAGGYGEDAWRLYANFILWAEAQLKS